MPIGLAVRASQWPDEVREDRISNPLLGFTVFLPVLVFYLASAHWTLNNTDSVAAAWPAWALVHHGTLHLEHISQLPRDPWFIRGAGGHLVSSRMPGVVLICVPMQALFAWSGWDAMAPSVITASVVTALAVALMTLLLRRISGARAALVGGLVLAFGTPLWTVAGAELWTHGPDALWLSAGLLALANRRSFLAGVLFAPAILTRPHLVIAVAAIGCVVAWSRRSPGALPRIALPAAGALALVVAYNWYLFGTATLSAGAYSYATHSAIVGNGSDVSSSLHNWAYNAGGILFSPMRGLLPYAPIALLPLFALRTSWRTLPDWGRGAAIGGVLYLLLQSRINGVNSSFGFYGSRLGIESIVLWCPIIFAAGRSLWLRGRRALLFATGTISFLAELAGAAFGRVMTVPLTADPWRTWLPIEVLRAAGAEGLMVGSLTLILVVLLGIRLIPKTVPDLDSVTRTSDPPREAGQPISPMFNSRARRDYGAATSAPDAP